MTAQFFAFILYFAAMLGIGIYFFLRDRSKSDKDYFLGGRQMGPYVTAMSAQASDMSGWLLMGFPGSILAFGMGKVWIGIGLALGTAANWLIVARRLRNFSKASNDSITLPQYLTNRFATANPVLKVTCAVIFLISFTVYVASAFNAGTLVFVAVLPKVFAGRELLVVVLQENSGSIRHRVNFMRDRYTETEGWWEVSITSFSPSNVTDDMAQWHVLIEMPEGLHTDPDEEITLLFTQR